MRSRACLVLIVALLGAVILTAQMWQGSNCAHYVSGDLRGSGWCLPAGWNTFGLLTSNNATVGGKAMTAVALAVLGNAGVGVLVVKRRNKLRAQGRAK